MSATWEKATDASGEMLQLRNRDGDVIAAVFAESRKAGTWTFRIVGTGSIWIRPPPAFATEAKAKAAALRELRLARQRLQPR